MHEISGTELIADGQLVGSVAGSLNEMVGSDRIAWCDRDAYDIHWSGELFKAARATPLFYLGAWGLTAMVGPTMRERGLEWLDQGPVRHRARDDAEQLLRALAYTVGIQSITVQDLVR